MTNRSKTKKGKKSLKLLDLSFEGQTADSLPTGGKFRPKGITQNVGVYRPHGGYRGTKSHPLGPYSFNKSTSNGRPNHSHVDDNFTNDLMSRPPSASPGWAIEVSSEPNHSGESPLFVHNFLAPSRVEQKSDTGNHLKSTLNGRQRPLSANDVGRYYRPNSTHQYLTTTELKNASKSEIDLRLGKPTRTTLLRARQKCNSAPQNAYNHRRELLKEAEKRMETRRSLTPSYSLQELIGLDISSEESLHSFLIGARYNRAHFLDSRSLITHGVYMPRGNPQGCFIVKSNKYQETDETPPAPPDSPADSDSDVDPCSSHVEPAFPRAPVPPPQRPASPGTLRETPQQAWDSELSPETVAVGDSSKSGQPEEPPSLAGVGDEGIKRSEDNKPILERIIALDEGLNVKGHSLNAPTPAPSPRTKIARSASAHSHLGNSTHSTAPSVISILPTITGTSINLTGKIGENPATTVSQTVPLPVTRKVPTRGNHQVSPESVSQVVEDKVSPDNPPKVMADKSFNVPSVAGDSQPPDVNLEDEVQVVTTTTIEPNDGAKEVMSDLYPEVKEEDEGAKDSDETVLPKEQTDTQPPNVEQGNIQNEEEDGRSLQSAKGRRSRVRFADEIAQEVGSEAAEGQEVTSSPGQGENVVFFLTEDETESANPETETETAKSKPEVAGSPDDVSQEKEPEHPSDQSSETSVDAASEQESTNPAENFYVIINKKSNLDPATDTANTKEDEIASGEISQRHVTSDTELNTAEEPTEDQPSENSDH